jgi:hypothetical protein
LPEMADNSLEADQCHLRQSTEYLAIINGIITY